MSAAAAPVVESATVGPDAITAMQDLGFDVYVYRVF